MRKNLLTFVVSVALVASAGAQTAPTSSKPRYLGPPTPVKEFQNELKEKREEFRKELEAKRDEMKAKLQADREALKQQLQKKVRDAVKRTAVERIDGQLKALNTRLLNHFSNVLGKLDAILVRIGARADKAAAKGIDVTRVRTAMTAAVNAIADARAAVVAQTNKTYSITVTTEPGLKQDVGKVRQALHADLAKVRDAVKKARGAVQEAARLLGQIRGVDDATPTSTPTSTTTSTSQ